MNPLTFFRSPAALAALERAAKCAAMPVSLHYVTSGREGPRQLSWGQCAACRYVHGRPNGGQACRNSRVHASDAAVRRGRPVPFVCHMGFACVSISALPQVDPGFVLTFGPYAPSGVDQSLEHDALQGLCKLDKAAEGKDEFPVSLDDVRRASAGSVPELAVWAVETLEALWRDAESEELEEADESEESELAGEPCSKRPRRAHDRLDDPYQASAIAMALAGDNQPQARALVGRELSEMVGGRQGRPAARRARAVAVVAAALEACERAKLDVGGGWERFFKTVHKLSSIRSQSDLLEWAMAVIGKVRRAVHGKVLRGATDSTELVALNRLVEARLAEGVALAEVAAELGRNATTITRQLQRGFGMSFTRYVNRLRVEKAKELLRRTKLPVGAIARRVGVSDVSNFGKLFREFEGVAPMSFRRRSSR